jgi:hypothetical protein
VIYHETVYKQEEDHSVSYIHGFYNLIKTKLNYEDIWAVMVINDHERIARRLVHLKLLTSDLTLTAIHYKSPRCFRLMLEKYNNIIPSHLEMLTSIYDVDSIRILAPLSHKKYEYYKISYFNLINDNKYSIIKVLFNNGILPLEHFLSIIKYTYSAGKKNIINLFKTKFNIQIVHQSDDVSVEVL